MAQTTEYTECQAFFPVVRIGSPHPPGSVAPPPFGSNGGGTFACEGENGGPNYEAGTGTLVLYEDCDPYGTNHLNNLKTTDNTKFQKIS